MVVVGSLVVMLRIRSLVVVFVRIYASVCCMIGCMSVWWMGRWKMGGCEVSVWWMGGFKMGGCEVGGCEVGGCEVGGCEVGVYLKLSSPYHFVV